MCKDRDESGSVTVEIALGMIGIVAILGLVLSGVSLALAQGQVCADAREAGRALIVGQSLPTTNAVIDVRHDGEWAKVIARHDVPLGHLLGFSAVECEFRARIEPQYSLEAQ